MAIVSIVSLTDVRTHLRYPNPTAPTTDDSALQRFINAAGEVISFECNEVVPATHSEFYDGGDYSIWLRHHPIISVDNIEEGWGWTNYELDYVQVNAPVTTTMFAYSIDNPETGEITRRSGGNVNIPFMHGVSNIHVIYTAGRENVPAAIQLASLELIAHWWQNSQLRAAALAGTNVSYDAVQGTTYTRDTESGTQNLNIGVPMRILEMLKPFRRDPIIG